MDLKSLGPPYNWRGMQTGSYQTEVHDLFKASKSGYREHKPMDSSFWDCNGANVEVVRRRKRTGWNGMTANAHPFPAGRAQIHCGSSTFRLALTGRKRSIMGLSP